jgi:hypothetical protein
MSMAAGSNVSRPCAYFSKYFDQGAPWTFVMLSASVRDMPIEALLAAPLGHSLALLSETHQSANRTVSSLR